MKSRNSMHRSLAIGGSVAAAALAIVLAGTAMAGQGLSEAGRAKLDKGHWGGAFGGTWIPGPYEKPYQVNPPLSPAAKAKMDKGHWGGWFGATWMPGPYRFATNGTPQLSDSTQRKMHEGRWGGTNGREWVTAGAAK